MIRPQAAREQHGRRAACSTPPYCKQHGGRKCTVKWDLYLKPKLAIMRQCTSVKDRQTDGQTDGH